MKLKEIIFSTYNLKTKYEKIVEDIKKNDENCVFSSIYTLNNNKEIIDNILSNYKNEHISLVYNSFKYKKNYITEDKKNASFYFNSKDNNSFVLFISSNKKIDLQRYNHLIPKYAKFNEKIDKKIYNETKKEYLANILEPNELIEHLQKKHLNFKDEKNAIEYLKHSSYYLIKEFSTIYRNSDNNYLKEDTDIFFSQIKARIDYNKQLRYNLFYVIDLIENSIQVNFAKILSKNSPTEYLDFNWINNTEYIYHIKSILKKAKIYLEEDYSNNYIIKFNETYISDKIPLLILIEKITLGDLNKIIIDTKDEIIKELANIYSLELNEFRLSLDLIKELRNKSAHGNNIIDIIYDNYFDDKTYKLDEIVNKIEKIFNAINISGIFKEEKSKLDTAKNIIKNSLYIGN